ncbi:MAG: tetratricopeptide repeat protein [Thermodesulfovibrionales bacterium]|nr:tetratricopeptide repeat protein [Thermodesulfovibrionales bacterium]
MKRILILLIVLLVSSSAEGTDLKKAAEENKDGVKKAIIYKQIGDYYTAIDDLKSASEAYIKALTLKREIFSIDERLKMAIRLSWAGRLEESLREFEYILSEDPDSLNARIHYARVLSWSGRLDDALNEIDSVLKKEPENRDALLVKANALRWKGNHLRAIEIYNNLLEKEDDFDSRLGLTYSLAAIGEMDAAEESLKLLKPSYPYQEKDLSELKAYLKNVKGPRIHMGYSYYSDSDDSIVSRYTIGINVRRGLWRFNTHYRLTLAEDNKFENEAHSLSVGLSKDYESYALSVSAGITNLENKDPSTVLTGSAKADIKLTKISVSLNLTRDVMTDTALLMEREIKFTETGIRIVGPLSHRLSLEGAYRFRDYSDSNYSHDLQGGLRYMLLRGNPSISTGYRLRYLDFKKQTKGGYFDPEDFISHQVFLSLQFSKEGLYLFIEPYGGHQSFRRYNQRTEDFFAGGSVTLGYTISNNFSIELSAEGGDYAAGAQAGFRYWMAGISLSGVL